MFFPLRLIDYLAMISFVKRNLPNKRLKQRADAVERKGSEREGKKE